MLNFLSVHFKFFVNYNKSCTGTRRLCVCVCVCACVFVAQIDSEKLFIKETNAGACLCIFMCLPTCFLHSVPPTMQHTSLHQGYFITVSQLPLPWVMARRDSLSDSDEVMSEPRTKLSLPCPNRNTEFISLPSNSPIFSFIYLFFLSNPWFLHITLPFHTQHALVGTIHNVVVSQGKKKCKEEKSIIELPWLMEAV